MRRTFLIGATLLVFVLSLGKICRMASEWQCGREQGFTCLVGVCSSCGGSTASSSFRYCPPCVSQRGLCRACGGGPHPLIDRLLGR